MEGEAPATRAGRVVALFRLVAEDTRAAVPSVAEAQAEDRAEAVPVAVEVEAADNRDNVGLEQPGQPQFYNQGPV